MITFHSVKAWTLFNDSTRNHTKHSTCQEGDKWDSEAWGPAGRGPGLYVILGLPLLPTRWPDTKRFVSLDSLFSKLYYRRCSAICWGRLSFLPALISMILGKPFKGKTFIKVLAQLQPSDSFMWWEIVHCRKTGRCLSKQVPLPHSCFFFFFFNHHWLLGSPAKAICWKDRYACYGGSTRETVKLGEDSLFRDIHSERAKENMIQSSKIQ